MTQRTLAESLAAYADSDYYPFHMPGHKRRLTEMLPDFPEALQRAARLDITEIDGFDNLHDPEGILKDAEEKAAALYGADSCYYSVNGSTAGLLTAISAAVPEGGKLILARNCHKAVYHSIYLRAADAGLSVSGYRAGDIPGRHADKRTDRSCADSESGRICSAFDLSDL